MEFVVGNFYKMRNGHKAQFMGITIFNEEQPLVFVQECGVPGSYCLNGYWNYEHAESKFDIVSEWTE